MDIGGVSSCNNAIYIRAHRETARLARALGAVETARELEARAETLAAAYRRGGAPRRRVRSDPRSRI